MDANSQTNIREGVKLYVHRASVQHSGRSIRHDDIPRLRFALTSKLNLLYELIITCRIASLATLETVQLSFNSSVYRFHLNWDEEVAASIQQYLEDVRNALLFFFTRLDVEVGMLHTYDVCCK